MEGDGRSIWQENAILRINLQEAKRALSDELCRKLGHGSPAGGEEGRKGEPGKGGRKRSSDGHVEMQRMQQVVCVLCVCCVYLSFCSCLWAGMPASVVSGNDTGICKSNVQASTLECACINGYMYACVLAHMYTHRFCLSTHGRVIAGKWCSILISNNFDHRYSLGPSARNYSTTY